jgi:hypothetical protein
VEAFLKYVHRFALALKKINKIKIKNKVSSINQSIKYLDPVEPAALCVGVLPRDNGYNIAAAEVEGVVVVAAEVGEGAAQLVLARPRLQAVLLDQLLDAA